jgi:hypothetical protein
MSAADFLHKADALKAKGMMAMFSPDLSLLKAEFTAGAKAWRAQVAPSGRPPNACPPATPLHMNDQEIYALIAAVPPDRRPTTSVQSAVVTGLNLRFPCR